LPTWRRRESLWSRGSKRGRNRALATLRPRAAA
jgi:hypothetical protein